MKKTIVTAALAGSLLVASPGPAQATTASPPCPAGDLTHIIMECGKLVFNTACAFVPPSLRCSWT